MTLFKDLYTFNTAVQFWNSGDLNSYLETIYHRDIVVHGLPLGLPKGIEGVRMYYHSLWAAFPNPMLIIDDVFGEEDRLAARYRFEAYHKGEFMNIPPTGNKVSVEGITILRFEHAKCIERWNQIDMQGWLKQLSEAEKI